LNAQDNRQAAARMSLHLTYNVKEPTTNTGTPSAPKPSGLETSVRQHLNASTASEAPPQRPAPSRWNPSRPHPDSGQHKNCHEIV